MSSKKYDLGLHFSRIGPAMKEILGLGKDVELAQFLDIPPQSISTYKKGRNKDHDIPASWIAKFQMKTGHTLDDLLKKRKEAAAASKEKMDRAENILIRYAGRLSGGDSELEQVMIELVKGWIEDYFRENKRDLVAWIMNSDNMSGPHTDSINRNSLVLIDTRIKRIEGSGIYAFTAAGEVIIRRVLKTVHGGIDLLNDNPAYGNLPMMRHGTLDAQMDILGRVVFIGKII